MLILSRKAGESIQIANDVTVKIIEIRGGLVRIGVEAPADVAVWRDEIYARLTPLEKGLGVKEVKP